MLKYTRIDTNWREHHGWPVSMRSFFFSFIIYILDQVCFIVVCLCCLI